MALYRAEHTLRTRSQEWESCVEWDTQGAPSMGTLFLALRTLITSTCCAADIYQKQADEPVRLELFVL